MKKLFSALLAITFYSFGSYQTASAIFCGNCSQLFMQIPEYANQLINTASSYLTSVNSVADDMNKYVLDPMANSMLAAVQIQKQLNTINFITAAFGNEGSLLIQNPEQWIKNKGKNQVQIALGSIQQENGLYKDSLLASVVGTYKSADDLNKTLEDLGSSNIPNAVQRNICNDSSLTNLAKNEVMRSDGSYDPNRLQARKSELYNTLCVGNPKTNANLARALTAINQQIPEIGGWDAWLLMTGGDNPYAQSVRTNLVIAKKVEETEQARRDELNRNGGIANKTECTERAFPVNAEDGDVSPDVTDTTLPCVVEQVTLTGNALNSQFQEALNAPLRKLQSTFGTGIYKSLQSIMSIVGSSQQMMTALNGTSGGSSPASSGSSVLITNTRDLTNPAQQAQTVETVRAPLERHLQALASLEAVENRFLSALSSYEGQINGLKQCYDSIEADIKAQYPGESEKVEAFRRDSRVASAYGYTNSKLSIITSHRTTSNGNLSKISETRTLINDTMASVTNSQSTQEIMDKFTAYQNQVKALGLPDFSASSQREGDLVRFQGDIQTDSIEGGPFPAHTSNCSAVRAQHMYTYTSGF